NSLRPEEQNQRNNPEPNCYAAIGRNRWQHVQIKNRDNKEKDEIPLSQHTLQMRMRFRDPVRQSVSSKAARDIDCAVFSLLHYFALVSRHKATSILVQSR